MAKTNYKDKLAIKLAAMKAAKQELLEEILSDKSLSKVEKLEAISDNELWERGGNVEEPFAKYYPAFKVIVNDNPITRKNYPNGDKNPIMDDYIVHSGIDRHEFCNLAEMAKCEEKRTTPITILTNRGTKDIFQISAEEFVNTIYEWCMENQMVEFEIDW